MDERLKVLQEELNKINQNILAYKAAAYDRIAEIDGILMAKRQQAQTKEPEKKEGE